MMKLARLLLLAPLACAPRATGVPTVAATVAPAPRPATRAERSGYTETSTYADVVAFLDSLSAMSSVEMTRGSLGTSTQGREIPYVVLSRPLVHGPEEARRLGRPIVWVQANIHAGEVEGKEAVQAMIRDLTTQHRPNVLDSLVVVFVPIYNTDGNEAFAPQAVNRTEQNGPEMVGQRANGQGLDLNRDYVKAEAPETRAALRFFDAWDPDVFVDLHTTDGSYHGYALTYSPSLSPAAALPGLTSGGAWAHDSLLPELRRRVRTRDGFPTFDYGNFDAGYEERDLTDTAKTGWYTYDHRPRFGTNYYGLRGRVAVLSEAYSHDPFERRVKSTYAFVRELLSLLAERAPAVTALRSRTDAAVAAAVARAAQVPVRGSLTRTPYTGDVIAEDLARVADSTVLTQPGVPRGLRRTGHLRTLHIPVYDRFDPTRWVTLPTAYALDAADTAAVRLLRLHGVRVDSLDAAEPAAIEAFYADSVIVAPRPFQGHHEVRLEGQWRRERRTLRAGGFLVSTAQPLGVLAAYLLEPESDDGFVTWGVLLPERTAVRLLRAGDR